MKRYSIVKVWLLMLAIMVIGFNQNISMAASNGVVRLEAYGYSGYYVRHADLAGRIDSGVTPIYDSMFIERAGLANSSYVSLESVNYPGYYLRHKNYFIYLEANDGSTTFKQDATFKKVSGLSNSSCYSYQSYNFPSYYIRHADFVLKLSTVSTSTDYADATFKVATYSKTFNNPRNTSTQRPDPFVYRDSSTGNYYGLHTVMNSSGYVAQIKLYQSKSLSNLFTSGTNKVIYTPSSGGWNNRDVWAPEIYKLNGTWYIYYSANWRVGVLACSSSDPMNGTWTDRGALTPSTEAAIDGTVLQQNGNLYLIYSRSISGTQYLYIRKMASPTALSGDAAVRLSAPTYSWEKQGLNVNEGPQILQRNGKTFCIHSASYCATQYYCLGMLSCSSTADPMNAGNWTKSSTSVFSQSTVDGLYGVGHGNFTQSPDGKEDWIVYHGCITASATTYQPRYVCMQQFGWNSDGTPNFGTPVGRKNMIPCPSGE
ncbi:MAG TPA: family 43 glycosylhydrolase [Bacillota bacterium]|nr:family 43 glycosylhydrolase [Bacillota bacterium]